MARPKDKVTVSLVASQPAGMSQAFANKSQQEEKLRLKVASGLREDLMSLFEQEVHSDLIVTNGSCEVRVHRCILQARAQDIGLERQMFATMDADGYDRNGIHVKWLTETQIRDFMRQLYCVNDAKLLFEELMPHLEHSPATEETKREPSPTLAAESLDGVDEIGAAERNSDILISGKNLSASCDSVTQIDFNNDSGRYVQMEGKRDISSGNARDALCETKNDCDSRESAVNVEETDDGSDGTQCEENGTKSQNEIKDEPCRENVSNFESEVRDETGCEKVTHVQDEVKGETGCEKVTHVQDEVKGETCCEKVPHVQDEVKGETGCEKVTNVQSEVKGKTQFEKETNYKNGFKEVTHCEHVTNAQIEVNGESLELKSNTPPIEVNGQLNVTHVTYGSNGINNVGNTVDADVPLDDQKTTTRALGCEQDYEHCHNWFNIKTETGLISGEENDDQRLPCKELNSNDPFLTKHSSTSEIIKDDSCQSVDNVNMPVNNKSRNETSVNSSMPSVAGGCIEANKEIDMRTYSSVNSTANGMHELKPPSESSKDADCFVNPYSTCSPLGNDLLRLYLQQLLCDCCLSVDGVHFLAHKCLLSARSPYFNAMFGGQWSESSLEVVQLEGISAAAMEKVLLFFYGGVIDVISSSDLLDLFIVADMYGVETMKLVLQFFIRKDMCHFFHKPCVTCISRSSEALSLCHSFNLEELQDRVLKWMTRHFTKIWFTKAFASLADALHQLCVENVISQMTEINVLDIIMDCDRLMTSLPRVKWTEPILCLTTQLMDLAIEHTSANFIKVIHAPEFLTWAKVASWKASALEEIFNSVVDSLPVDTAISVYQTLIDLKTNQTMLESTEQNLLDLLETMIKRCEKFLRTHIHMVTRSKQWSSINKTFQSQILESSSYFHLDHFPDPKPRPKRPVMTSSLAKSKSRSGSPSSVSSPSTTSRSSKATATFSAMGQRPTRKQASHKSAASTSRDSSTPTKGRDQKNTSNVNSTCTRTPSQLSKALASSVRSSSKSPGGDQDTIQEKESYSKDLGACTIENSDEKVGQPSSASKLNSDDVKNKNRSTARLSSSLQSDKHSICMGRSPPSRLPLKISSDKAHELLVRPQESSTSTALKRNPDGRKEISLPLENVSSNSSNSMTDGQNPVSLVLSDIPYYEISTEDKDQANVFVSEKLTDSLHAAKFDALKVEGSDACEGTEAFPTQTRPSGKLLSVGVSYQKGGEPGHHNASDTTHRSNNSDSAFLGQGVSQTQVSHDRKILDGGQSQMLVGTRCSDGSEIEVFVQRETNFVKVCEPVRVSFVVPDIPDD